MKLRKKKFNNPFFKEREGKGAGVLVGGGGRKTNTYGSCLKRGPWPVHRFKVAGGGLPKKEGVEFFRRGDIPHCTLLH